MTDLSLIVVSGPSQTGKDTNVGRYCEGHEDFVKTISDTTRSPRFGEENGVDYYFRTQKEFEQMIKENVFIEYNDYNGNFYGKSELALNSILQVKQNPISIQDVNGAKAMFQKYGKLYSVPDIELKANISYVFLLPFDSEVYKERLFSARDINNPEGRFKAALDEIKYLGKDSFYDFVINTTQSFEDVYLDFCAVIWHEVWDNKTKHAKKVFEATDDSTLLHECKAWLHGHPSLIHEYIRASEKCRWTSKLKKAWSTAKWEDEVFVLKEFQHQRIFYIPLEPVDHI